MKRNLLFLTLLFLVLFVACAKENPKQLKEDDLIQIDGNSIQAEEVAVYGIQVKKEFEQIGGKDVWEFESFSGGKSAYEVAKSKVLENIIRVKILASKAKERNIELTKAEQENIKQKAKEFFADKKSLSASSQNISLDQVQSVFEDYELGQKLKQEMLRTFHPTPEVIEQKLSENESYQKLIKENPKDKYKIYVLEMGVIEATEKNQKRIAEIQNQLKANNGLTESLSQSIVYQEERYSKLELEQIFGEGIAKSLEIKPVQLFLDEKSNNYILIKIKAVEMSDDSNLKNDIENIKQQKEELRKQTEEEIKNESFDVIYQEWKRKVDIQVNQEYWQQFVVFSLTKQEIGD